MDKVNADADRTRRLEERGVVSASEGDAARAAVSDAQAQLEGAQFDLASTTVVAPHFGVVTNVTLVSGQYANAGSPAMTFIDASAAWVTVGLIAAQRMAFSPVQAMAGPLHSRWPSG